MKFSEVDSRCRKQEDEIYWTTKGLNYVKHRICGRKLICTGQMPGTKPNKNEISETI